MRFQMAHNNETRPVPNNNVTEHAGKVVPPVIIIQCESAARRGKGSRGKASQKCTKASRRRRKRTNGTIERNNLANNRNQ